MLQDLPTNCTRNPMSRSMHDSSIDTNHAQKQAWLLARRVLGAPKTREKLGVSGVPRRAMVGDKSRRGEAADGLGHADLRREVYTYASTRADMACGRDAPMALVGGARLKQWAQSSYLLVITD